MIREKIKHYRIHAGYSQSKLAEKIGCRIATISDFETGKKSIRSDLLEKIFKVLCLEIINIPKNPS